MPKKEVFEKEKKPKKVMSDEQKDRLKAQLAKGRATSLANRQKKAMVKKIDKEDDVKAQDEKIAKSVLGKKLDSSNELAELRAEIKAMKAQGGNRAEIDELKSHIGVLTGSLTSFLEQARKPKPSVQSADKIEMKIEPKIEMKIEPKVQEVAKPPEKKAYVSRSSRMAGFL
tara:strand:- start:482 stop:994 length:513 start_codon:yes stop_codon:yes gene_type:complete